MDAKNAVEILLNRCSASFKGQNVNLFSIEETKQIIDLIEQQAEQITYLRQQLKSIEWDVSRGETEMEYQCNACGGRKFYGGHKPKCWINNEINKLDGGSGE